MKLAINAKIISTKYKRLLISALLISSCSKVIIESNWKTYDRKNNGIVVIGISTPIRQIETLELFLENQKTKEVLSFKVPNSYRRFAMTKDEYKSNPIDFVVGNASYNMFYFSTWDNYKYYMINIKNGSYKIKKYDLNIIDDYKKTKKMSFEYPPNTELKVDQGRITYVGSFKFGNSMKDWIFNLSGNLFLGDMIFWSDTYEDAKNYLYEKYGIDEQVYRKLMKTDFTNIKDSKNVINSYLEKHKEFCKKHNLELKVKECIIYNKYSFDLQDTEFYKEDSNYKIYINKDLVINKNDELYLSNLERYYKEYSSRFEIFQQEPVDELAKYYAARSVYLTIPKRISKKEITKEYIEE